MKIYYDTEFVEDGKTIGLVSIGIVADSGDEYYAVSNQFSFYRFAANPWLIENVWPGLPQALAPREVDDTAPTFMNSQHKRLWQTFDWSHPDVKSRSVIADEVRQFILSFPAPELWAWYGAYDHVALCQLFGRMIDLPAGMPMFTNDLKQEAMRLGNPRVPEQPDGQHNALADARHNKVIADFLAARGE